MQLQLSESIHPVQRIAGTLVLRLPRSWNLTPAEARTVTSLAFGATTADIARAHRRSIHTVRTHLKRAMAKAGVHSQTVLIATLLALSV